MGTHLKSAGVDQLRRAISAGGSLAPMPTSFYSGGHTYTHVLTTARGTQYRVARQVLRAIGPTTN